MDEWNRNQHRKSGLWQRVIESRIAGRGRSAHAGLPRRMGAGQRLADVRQLDLPGPSFLHR
jgi:hypothetical protein